MADADPQRDLRAETATPIEITVPKRRRWRGIALVSVPLLLVAIGLFLWLTSGGSVSTDNAYVQQDKVSVSSDIGGRIVEVDVHENQPVKSGDVLFRIDPAPYRIALEQANAAIANAQVQVQSLRADLAGKGADITAAHDAILNAQQDYDRQAALMKQGFTTRARLEQSQHSLEQARAQLGNADAARVEAQAKAANGTAVPGVNPVVAAAMAQRDKAALDLSRTVVRAPVSGVVSQSDRLQVGQMMITGLPAVSIVISGHTWIVANFKEEELRHMRVGQPATISVDAYAGKLTGRVESIGAGTGSEFSVLPAQNANGNWVKVTQRVPVRIAINGTGNRALIAGLSSKVTVDTSGDTSSDGNR